MRVLTSQKCQCKVPCSPRTSIVLVAASHLVLVALRDAEEDARAPGCQAHFISCRMLTPWAF